MARPSASFEGYLLKFPDTSKTFPHKYIELSSWKSTPKHREELEAVRDDNTRNLTRITADGTKSEFTFNTRSNLHLSEKNAILDMLYNACANYGSGTSSSPNETALKQRKLKCKYWDDENSKYDTGAFYIADIEYTIKKITDDDIIYDKITFEFTEY